MIQFNWHSFSELSTKQVYEILRLRADVFVVEQNICYLDPDEKDYSAHHLLGVENNKLVAYLRLFSPTTIENKVKFGRVLTSSSARTKGYGKRLIHELIAYCRTAFPETPITCSAQHYLLRFYENFGFKAHGDIYEEEGIPHIVMNRV